MPWKMVEGKTALDANGLPVYVFPDGKEEALDGDRLYTKVQSLNAESGDHRKAREEAEAKLKIYLDAGLTDPKAAAEALATVANLKEAQKESANKIETIKAEAEKTLRQQIAEMETKHKEEISLRDAQLWDMRLGREFHDSEFVAKKLGVPVDMLRTFFGANYKEVDGKIVGHLNGQPIFGKIPGEYATFDEALERIVEAYSHKESLYKSVNPNGSGAPHSGRPGRGENTMTRSEFGALSPQAKMDFSKKGGQLIDDAA